MRRSTLTGSPVRGSYAHIVGVLTGLSLLIAKEIPMHPMLDPKRDLKGATPETLARALLRPRRVPQAVVGDEVAVTEVPANQPRNGVAHLREGVELP